jgi:hypothetical protein
MSTIPEDPAERRERDREPPQGTTFHQHAVAWADELSQGRFAAIGTPTVIGTEPIPKYPQASEPFRVDPVGDEPPLSAYENPAIEPSAETTRSVEDTSGAPSSPPDVVAPPPSSEQSDE